VVRQLSTSSSKKSEEQKRVEGGLRNLFKAQYELLTENKDTSQVNKKIAEYIAKYPDLQKAQKQLNEEARSKTGLFSYYAKDLSKSELQRVRKEATDPDYIKVLDKLLEARDKPKTETKKSERMW
jgi:hypothetical protein